MQTQRQFLPSVASFPGVPSSGQGDPESNIAHGLAIPLE